MSFNHCIAKLQIRNCLLREPGTTESARNDEGSNEPDGRRQNTHRVSPELQWGRHFVMRIHSDTPEITAKRIFRNGIQSGRMKIHPEVDLVHE